MTRLYRGLEGKPVAFADLQAKDFPVEITAFGPDGSVVWERSIEAYTMVEIPASPPELAGKISVRIKFGDGAVVMQGPMSVEDAEAYLEKRIEETD